MKQLIRSFLLGLVLALMMPSVVLAADVVRMGIVLPLKEKSSRGAKMVEFYQGMLLAVDSMKHMGLNIDIRAYDSGSTEEDMQQLLDRAELSDRDVVFGPLDGAQVPLLADFCTLHGVRLVIPFSTQTDFVANRPCTYLVNAPRSGVLQEASGMAASIFEDYNYVFVDTHDDNDEGMAFSATLQQAVADVNPFVRNLDIDGDEMAYFQAFNTLRQNVVVPNSASISALTKKLLPRLSTFANEHPSCQISLLGYPDWQAVGADVRETLFRFDTHLYTTFFRNTDDRRVTAMEERFRKEFGRPMTQTYPRYALMGYDLGLYFLLGLKTYGTELEQHHSELSVEPLQHPVCFERAGEGDGFVNRFVQFVRFTPWKCFDFFLRNPLR